MGYPHGQAAGTRLRAYKSLKMAPQRASELFNDSLAFLDAGFVPRSVHSSEVILQVNGHPADALLALHDPPLVRTEDS